MRLSVGSLAVPVPVRDLSGVTVDLGAELTTAGFLGIDMHSPHRRVHSTTHGLEVDPVAGDPAFANRECDRLTFAYLETLGSEVAVAWEFDGARAHSNLLSLRVRFGTRRREGYEPDNQQRDGSNGCAHPPRLASLQAVLMRNYVRRRTLTYYEKQCRSSGLTNERGSPASAR